MLSDMAEGSADYSEEPYDDYNDGDDDMSGDGSGEGSISKSFQHYAFLLALTLIFSLVTDGRTNIPMVPGAPDFTLNTINVSPDPTSNAPRISLTSSTLVLSSLFVILFKQF